MGGNEKYFHAVPDPGGEGETLRLAGVVEGGRRCGGGREGEGVVERGREKVWWREEDRSCGGEREGEDVVEGGREGEDVAKGRGEKI